MGPSAKTLEAMELLAEQTTKSSSPSPTETRNRAFVGIDNGVTGSIGIILTGPVYGQETRFYKTPVVNEQDYTKRKKRISRVSVVELESIFCGQFGITGRECFHVVLERPMINPKRWTASTSALRAMEATLCVLERLTLAKQWVDSRDWQKVLLPKGVKGAPALKQASHDIGIRLFPQHKELIEEHGDADGLLIAEYCRRMMR